MKIDVWSDIVCPFCYIGKKKLEQAIVRAGLEKRLEIEYHSFQLDPDFPIDKGIPSAEHLAKKGYPMSQIEASQVRLSDNGKLYDIDYQFKNAISFNTLNAHRLLHWAKNFGKQAELKEAFMHAHFTLGFDLSKSENILSVIQSIGLEKQAAQNVLESDHYTQEFKADVELARHIGINGVPFFIFNRKTALSGAQPDDVFDEVIKEAAGTCVAS